MLEENKGHRRREKETIAGCKWVVLKTEKGDKRREEWRREK